MDPCVNEDNAARFARVCAKVLAAGKETDGIGTLGEKTLHAVMKAYLAPFADDREVKIGRYVADIVSEDGIMEIQTRDFSRLRGKLAAFLPEVPVTVVYPIAAQKTLYWMDAETGELSAPRRSPKKGSALEIFGELYKIRPFLANPRLRLRILLLDVEEYRFLGDAPAGKSASDDWKFGGRKKQSVRFDRIPRRLLQEICVDSHADYRQFIPQTLGNGFTSKEFAKAAHCSIGLAQQCLLLLTDMGAVVRVGKQKNSFVYERG